MLLYLSEYKLAQHLNDKNISVLAKILSCFFAAFIILSLLIKSIHIFPSNLMWLALFLSFIPLFVKNRKNIKSLAMHLTYLLFPIAVKAWLLNILILLINGGIAIGYVTYASTNTNSRMDSMMDGMLSGATKEPTPSNDSTFTALDGDMVALMSSIIGLAVAIIFVRWRYHECLKIMDKYDV